MSNLSVLQKTIPERVIHYNRMLIMQSTVIDSEGSPAGVIVLALSILHVHLPEVKTVDSLR